MFFLILLDLALLTTMGSGLWLLARRMRHVAHVVESEMEQEPAVAGALPIVVAQEERLS